METKEIVPPQLNALAGEIHRRNIAKGFFEEKKNIGEMLALMHSEISEALEADRKSRYCHNENGSPIKVFLAAESMEDADFVEWYSDNVKGTFEEEMADIFIRVMDMCGYKNIDIVSHVHAKMRFNATREYKHGKKY